MHVIMFMLVGMNVGIIVDAGFVQQYGPLYSQNESTSCPRSFIQGLTYTLCVHSPSSDEGCCNIHKRVADNS